MLHGAEKGRFELEFALPAECAERMAAGEAEVGLVPSIELARQGLARVPGTGVASFGAVWSILLVTKVEPERIRTLATDTSSRTSVVLAQVVLRRRYGVRPALYPHPPEVSRMLAAADAAVLIGDPALRLNRDGLPYRVLDLGQEWTGMTGLPMVFAVWAARDRSLARELAPAFVNSCRYGRERLEEIVRQEAPRRGLTEELARDYLSRRIINLHGEREQAGLEEFLAEARRLEVHAHA